MDLSEATSKALTVKLAGRDWLVKIRPLSELADLQTWFKQAIPSPLVRAMEAAEKAKAAKVGQAIINLVIEHAQRAELAWPPRIGSWHWLDAVDQAGKQGRVVSFALSPHHPEVNEAEADKLIEAAEPGEVATLACVLFHGRLPDPKELAPPMGPTMTSQTSQSATTGATFSTTSR
jgi:hypothetical protein